MDEFSEEESKSKKNVNQMKPKRKMKTPFQLETLEHVYALDMYPSEATRAELSEKLGLTDRQLQMWFCHKRLKDKKDAAGVAVMKPRAGGCGTGGKRNLVEFPREDLMVAEPVGDRGSGSASRSGSGSGSGSDSDSRSESSQFDNGDVTPTVPFRFCESAGSVLERRVIACIEEQLGEPLRKDGPIVGVEFDVLPAGAFGASVVVAERQDRCRNSSERKSFGGYDTKNINNAEAGTGSDVGAHRKRVHKELEKKDIIRQKREEQLRKEMERHDCKRREEQRMMLEQQMREEQFQREERHAIETREKLLKQESLSSERRKQEELRKEKEAAKQKAAMSRTTARKIAKESIELIEDERLELMELAARSKGLPSIASLDFDSLQNLECFRESLCEFPPKSVKRKRPFSTQPWIASDDNVGNLLMAWRFCINFADILGLWPFTLDEFIQAFHDYDSRLLAEIHIALLKLIIKDIEDVSRIPPSGLGTNQYTAAHLEGGHPQIVERAYLWGFDICNWKKQLNPLTWPEVLRQFALSAGFGPQLKKKSTDRACLNDSDEIKGCEDIVSTLRSGSAAEAAVALMQDKKFKVQQRFRHRLTPGTVKFAAYHVLALEGDKGLNVLELADKIQKSGLRDLSTSRTPDASVSVALSRDPVLFKRIAPSTYYVRPAFRKDPATAEAVLSAAREEIQRYIKGVLAGQNAEDEERDDDSEGEVAEGPELVDLGTPSDANKNSEQCNIVAACLVKRKSKRTGEVAQQNGINAAGIGLRNRGKESSEIDESKAGEPWVQGLAEGEYSDLCVEDRLNALIALIYVANEGHTIRAVLEDRFDAANALKKQMWAEAQLGKRRLKEGTINKFHNSASNAAREGSQILLEVPDSKHQEVSPSTLVMDVSPVMVDNLQNHLVSVPGENGSAAQENFVGQFISPNLQNGNTAERLRMQLKSFIGHKADDMYVYRSLPLGQDRRHNRYWVFAASSSSQDPGSGRIFVESLNGCWRLIDTEEAFNSLLTSLDTRGIMESHLHIMLQDIEASFRECARKSMSHFGTAGQHGNTSRSEAAEASSCPVSDNGISCPSSSIHGMSSDGCEPSSSLSVEIGQNEEETRNALRRYHDFQIWMWKECFSSSISHAMKFGKKRCFPVLGICDHCLDSYFLEEDQCSTCGKIFGKVDIAEFPKKATGYWDNLEVDYRNFVVSNSSRPLRIRLIKALLSFLEVRLPSEALQSYWSEDCRKSWGLQLQNSVSAQDLLQILTRLENGVKRDYLSSNFETTEELLGNRALSRNAASEKSACAGSVPQLPWIPLTTAAVALRLLELDSSISYNLKRKAEPRCKSEVDLVIAEKPSSKYASLKVLQKVESMEVYPNGQSMEGSWDNLGNFPSGSRSRNVVRGRGGSRPRGRSQKGTRSTPESARAGIRPAETITQILLKQGEISGRSHARGPRTQRRRRTEKKVVEEILPAYLGDKDNQQTAIVSPKNRGREVFDMDVERATNDDSNSMAAVESEGSDHKNTYEFRKWEAEYNVTPNGRNDVGEMSDEDMNDDEGDDNDNDDNRYQELGQHLGRDVQMDGNDNNGRINEVDDDQDSDSAVGIDYSE